MKSEDAKTQKSVNYEVGAKWASAQDTLSLTAALFRTERQCRHCGASDRDHAYRTDGL